MSVGETTITVVGNLTADPELRFIPTGAAVASFTVASTPRAYDKASGEWKDGDALFLRCSIWRQYAENVAESLTKGMRVVVTGRLKQRSYEDREGVKRTVVEVDVEEVGPSLRFATAKVVKATRAAGTAASQGASDPFASPAPAGVGAAAGGTWGGGYTDEPPF
jgi:single-strand DNA-binding protein